MRLSVPETAPLPLPRYRYAYLLTCTVRLRQFGICGAGYVLGEVPAVGDRHVPITRAVDHQRRNRRPGSSGRTSTAAAHLHIASMDPGEQVCRLIWAAQSRSRRCRPSRAPGRRRSPPCPTRGRRRWPTHRPGPVRPRSRTHPAGRLREPAPPRPESTTRAHAAKRLQKCSRAGSSLASSSWLIGGETKTIVTGPSRAPTLRVQGGTPENRVIKPERPRCLPRDRLIAHGANGMAAIVHGCPLCADAVAAAEAVGGDVVGDLAADGKRRPIARFASSTPSRHVEGNVAAMALYAGEGPGDVRDVRPACPSRRGSCREPRLKTAVGRCRARFRAGTSS